MKRTLHFAGEVALACVLVPLLHAAVWLDKLARPRRYAP